MWVGVLVHVARNDGEKKLALVMCHVIYTKLQTLLYRIMSEAKFNISKVYITFISN